MGMTQEADCPPLVEPYPVQEIYATSIRRVRDIGDMVRITFYSRTSEQDGDPVRIIVARIVMSRSNYHGMVRKMIGAPMVMS